MATFSVGRFSGRYSGYSAEEWFSKYDQCDADQMYWESTHSGLLDFEQCVEKHTQAQKELILRMCPPERDDTIECLLNLSGRGIAPEDPHYCFSEYLQNR